MVLVVKVGMCLLDNDVDQCTLYYCEQHVGKMILESA
jgi:hypothetical protein